MTSKDMARWHACQAALGEVRALAYDASLAVDAALEVNSASLDYLAARSRELHAIRRLLESRTLDAAKVLEARR